MREYRTRIELRQIGVRHETQMLGAIGNCGQMCCCRRFMRKFVPVTIKMAKEQNLFLNPTKISGICGRLLCCLSFEQQGYEEFHRMCPKVGKKYTTALGSVKVLRSNFFKKSLSLLAENYEEREVSIDEWNEIVNKPPSEEAMAEARAQAPRGRGGRRRPAKPRPSGPKGRDGESGGESGDRRRRDARSDKPRKDKRDKDQKQSRPSRPPRSDADGAGDDKSKKARRPRRRRRRPPKK